MASLLRKPGVSSDYAAQLEALGDVATALRPMLLDMFPGMRVVVGVYEPPVAPQAGVVVQLDHDFGEFLPLPARARLEEAMAATAKAVRTGFALIPMTIAHLTPPLAARHGFLVTVTNPAAAPVYPRLVKATARLWPTEYLRRLRGQKE